MVVPIPGVWGENQLCGFDDVGFGWLGSIMAGLHSCSGQGRNKSQSLWMEKQMSFFLQKKPTSQYGWLFIVNGDLVNGS